MTNRLAQVLILSLLLFLPGCRKRTPPWQTLDFGRFSVRVPDDWSKVVEPGVDSSFEGGLTDGTDSLWFNFGGLKGHDFTPPYWCRMATDTVNCFEVIILIADSLQKGYLSMAMPRVTEGNRFTIWGEKLQRTAIALQIYKTIRFQKNASSHNLPMTQADFIKTSSNPEAIFSSNCLACHPIHGAIDGPRLRDMMAERSSQWIYKYLTDQKFRESDRFHQQLKRDFNGYECPLIPRLTKQAIVALSYYVATQ